MLIPGRMLLNGTMCNGEVSQNVFVSQNFYPLPSKFLTHKVTIRAQYIYLMFVLYPCSKFTRHTNTPIFFVNSKSRQLLRHFVSALVNSELYINYLSLPPNIFASFICF